MKKIIYIATIGLLDGEPNIGPLESGIFSIAPQKIEKVYILIENERDIANNLVVKYPYLQNKVFLKIIESFNYQTLLKSILEIQNENPTNVFQYCVNITGGTKPMSLGAFMGAILIGAEIQYTKRDKSNRGEDEIIYITMPKIPVNEMHKIQRLIIYVLKNEAKMKPMIQSEVRRIIKEKYSGKKDTPLSKKTEIQPQLFSYHCNILVENGIITREDDPNNRKVNLLVLTEIGKILADFIMLT